MNVTGYVVRVRLSPGGRSDLGPLVNGQQDFDALVVDQDGSGLWISLLPEQGDAGAAIMLLKWEHFTTVIFEYQPEAPADRPRAGFKP